MLVNDQLNLGKRITTADHEAADRPAGTAAGRLSDSG
jgi:hypothetical protein